MEPTERRDALDRVYALLDDLRRLDGQDRRLDELRSSDVTPSHGVYLFTEPGEVREDQHTPRVVRVGTHGLRENSSSTLWSRLRTHRGPVSGSSLGRGNHRASVFRLHVGTALMDADEHYAHLEPTWGHRSSADADTRKREAPLEVAVSRHLGAMRVLWLSVPDRLQRGAIERGLIALLSNAGRAPFDPPSEGWLGHMADREAVRASGMWNVNHVTDVANADVIRHLEEAVQRTLGGVSTMGVSATDTPDVAAMAAVEARFIDRVRRELRGLDNTTRGTFAEELVATVLPGARTRVNWAGWDVEWDGLRIEVKTSGAIQSWHKADDEPSPAVWSVPERKAWDPDTNEYADASARSADIYILCRHEGTDIKEGWSFHVVGTTALDELAQASVRASTLEDVATGPVELDGLEAAVREVARG